MGRPTLEALDDGAGKFGAGRTATTILDAARRLFLSDGLDGVNLDQVGRAAGVSRQTVYNQFGSKDALFRAVIDRHWSAIREETRALDPGSASPSADPTAVLLGFAQALLRFVHGTDQIAFTRLIVAESRRLPWIAEEFYRVGKAPVVEAFTAVLDSLVADGSLRCSNPMLAAHQFMGMVQEFVIWPKVMAIGDALHRLPGDTEVVEEAVATFLARYAAPRS
ncbi:TetR/AcrR family transcriptional regulator [Lichenibacterium minor]|uniref:TetR/AcrR family transcriptional regulator n=1 Tax=Lichenibacterium minor TaxID=2316528 RepID=A0A4Q2U2M7_9HYPH|nr:TetR/AcrR family transcriptional regulator [Lichenibacterium minor]RYC29107.1 TetR/AcrR family transcriptional regulator [Lichenibacterium minor]